MYIVAQCHRRNDGTPVLGTFYCRNTWEESFDLAVQLAAEKCDVPAEAIREEIETDNDFYDPNNEWSICIGLCETEEPAESSGFVGE